ncbi:MAG: D-alanine--D-alanine ligase [Bacteroidetes bacterium]|nr:MAG: D-alanine--D-alanine ligase [Bacteroidota bacterium]
MNWEYWPFHVVYAPIYAYWFWLCIKARSFFFFSAANPSIANGGFLMERKHQIFELIPAKYYPPTVYCAMGRDIEWLLQMMADRGINFPTIAKPDIGMRGLRVELVQNAESLRRYLQQSPVDFIVQSYIPYEHEVGIFYYRLPGEAQGRISGIVGKNFLAVIGDGQSTIRQLLAKDDRFYLQLPALEAQLAEALDVILPPLETKTLVPYGNHARGAEFLDLSQKNNADLEKSIDAVCRQISGFYFGRLDVKFKTWADLCAGRHFSIVELNGAGSEPTHMYDPKHSIFFAWKEIIRHWKLLYLISKQNKALHGLAYMSWRDGLTMLKQNSVQVKLIN